MQKSTSMVIRGALNDYLNTFYMVSMQQVEDDDKLLSEAVHHIGYTYVLLESSVSDCYLPQCYL